jgi:hypothetical protein
MLKPSNQPRLHVSYKFIFAPKGIYSNSANTWTLSDGIREMDSAQFNDLATSTTPQTCTTANCNCVYLDSSSNLNTADCTENRQYMCEHKGIFSV